jgi:hypothetical protein
LFSDHAHLFSEAPKAFPDPANHFQDTARPFSGTANGFFGTARAFSFQIPPLSDPDFQKYPSENEFSKSANKCAKCKNSRASPNVAGTSCSSRVGTIRLACSGGLRPSHDANAEEPATDRRSNGERELADLSGKSLLLPKDPAFHPDEEGLEWRCNQLIA